MEHKFKLCTFKLGNNFSNFISDVLTERINNLDYYEAFEFLKTVGLEKDEAIGVLFGDYEIANTENEIILADNFSEPKFNLHAPIEKFINDYYTAYREILENTSNILVQNKLIYINIYDTDDKELSNITKYFTVDFDLLMNPNTNGEIAVNSIRFFNNLFNAYNNGEFKDLINSLITRYSENRLIDMCCYYFDSRKILDVWNKIKRCISFLNLYDNPHDLNPLLNKLSGLETGFSTTYEFFTDEVNFYCMFSGLKFSKYYGLF